MPKPIAVLLSDVHYRLDTLKLADASMRQAIDSAALLALPLYVCGDLNDTKAIIRGEIALALIETLRYARDKGVQVYVIVGNHDRLHEKAPAHSLEFLKPYATVADKVTFLDNLTLIPYQASPEDFSLALNMIEKGSQIIIHQGVIGAKMGHYFKDHSAISADLLKDYKSVGGHYHNHHTIGTHTFIGNPYTLTFAEHGDGPKGYCVLYDDGSLEQIPTNLRKHIVVERTMDTLLDPLQNYHTGDLLWLKVTGPSLELERLTRANVANALGVSENFKFDKIPTTLNRVDIDQKTVQSSSEIMDALIESSDESEVEKGALKALYREVLK